MPNVIRSIDVVATGARIRNLRKLCKVKVSELQTYFGFENPQAIYKWEKGGSLPSIDNLYALSDYYRDNHHMNVLMEDIVVRYGDEKAPFRKDDNSQDSGNGSSGCHCFMGMLSARAVRFPFSQKKVFSGETVRTTSPLSGKIKKKGETCEQISPEMKFYVP